MIIIISQDHRLWAQRALRFLRHHTSISSLTDGPNVTHTAARAADFIHHKLALLCFSVYALAPPLAHLFLAATLCGEAGMLSLNAGEESEAQRGCVT